MKHHIILCIFFIVTCSSMQAQEVNPALVLQTLDAQVIQSTHNGSAQAATGTACEHVTNTDLVIFSFDRPLQLYALLESIEEYVTGLSSVQVICRISSEPFAQAYQEVQSRFPAVHYTIQGANPSADFKSLTLEAVLNSPGEYIMFAVDDDIVKDYVDVNHCIGLMEQYKAYAFYLWLGTHICECYSLGCEQKVPPHVEVEQGVIAWRFKNAPCDWGYPNTVDLALYRKKDIAHYLQSMHYSAPNSFEGAWAGRTHTAMAYGKGLCFEDSKIVNLPLNRVQHEFRNRNMGFMTPAQMLEVFNAGKKIDTSPLFKIKNRDPHMVYEPTFVHR